LMLEKHTNKFVLENSKQRKLNNRKPHMFSFILFSALAVLFVIHDMFSCTDNKVVLCDGAFSVCFYSK
jgi:hypothetical protein